MELSDRQRVGQRVVQGRCHSSRVGERRVGVRAEADRRLPVALSKQVDLRVAVKCDHLADGGTAEGVGVQARRVQSESDGSARKQCRN